MPAPVRHTCPGIDRVINRIKAALKYADDGKDITEKGSDEWNCFDYVMDELYRLDDELENLRSSNSALREWGEELEKEIIYKDDEINTLADKVSNLIHY